MKKFEFVVELFLNASHWETFTVEANTERKAKIFLNKKVTKKYPTIGHMINIVNTKEIT